MRYCYILYVVKFLMQIIYELFGSKQLITNNLHQEFNNICLNENLLPLPIYTNIYIYIYMTKVE